MVSYSPHKTLCWPLFYILFQLCTHLTKQHSNCKCYIIFWKYKMSPSIIQIHFLSQLTRRDRNNCSLAKNIYITKEHAHAVDVDSMLMVVFYKTLSHSQHMTLSSNLLCTRLHLFFTFVSYILFNVNHCVTHFPLHVLSSPCTFHSHHSCTLLQGQRPGPCEKCSSV